MLHVTIILNCSTFVHCVHLHLLCESLPLVVQSNLVHSCVCLCVFSGANIRTYVCVINNSRTCSSTEADKKWDDTDIECDVAM